MDKYCCFFCPAKDYSDKTLDDKCSSCDRTYGFILDKFPEEIREYKIKKGLGRGFYGAAYVAETGSFGKKVVLKISPVEFYSFFDNKDFDEESKLHHELAQNAVHVIDIIDAFEDEVQFSDKEKTKLKCFITVLDFVDGEPLRKYIDGSIPVTVNTVCQIAIDLLQIREEFNANLKNHNDLHDENLIVENLRSEVSRPDAIDDSIRVMAIDLGSISGESKSTEARMGDLRSIASHIDSLLSRLLSDPTHLEDRDYRVALALQSIMNGMLSNVQNVRLPRLTDVIEQIRDAYYRASQQWMPWNNPLQLKSFADHYNAQTMESWNVPKLLVDPDGQWLDKVTTKGPQIITGMRGCGKTMLLRALDIHARAARKNREKDEDIIKRIKTDGFIGLYVSASRLLDLREQSLFKIEYSVTRLFVSYSLQAVRALIHIKDVSSSIVIQNAHIKMSGAISDYLEGEDELLNCNSLEDLENRLVKTLVRANKGDSNLIVKQAPAEVFTHLAEQFRACASIVSNSTVYFLLDDVSTRYLELDKIERLVSTLLYQNPTCAFKFTSEWQTIELGLKSPARLHPIRIDRDLSLFDLGAEVHQMTKADGNKGKNFVAQILQQRAGFHVSHPAHSSVKDLIGDVPLEQVALEIASSSDTSNKRKNVYRGLSCLTKMCVGDIGDVIKLYEDILKRASNEAARPIPDKIQSECFRDINAHRLYDLNRRESYFKGHALAFSQAAHKLLVRSYKEGKKKDEKKIRLRQYTLLYVRITTDDPTSTKHQIDRLRDLIDAGVFVFAGGAPRSKTKDSNPIQQFILSYRKIYGISAFIGLADRDRFELSGDDLESWLDNPALAEEILIRNQITEEIDLLESSIEVTSASQEAAEDDSELISEASSKNSDATDKSVATLHQADIFEGAQASQNIEEISEYRANEINIAIEQVDEDILSQLKIGSVLTGLGFEDRTLASNEYLSRLIKPDFVHTVRYSLDGHANKIKKLWEAADKKIIEYNYTETLVALPKLRGLALIDISGLSKPLIYQAIREELTSKGRVLISHQAAKHYYPLHDDLDKLFAAKKADNPIEFLDSLGNVLMGEKGPYKDIRLLDEDIDPTRNRALLAFASAKHERLFSLLDRREFDYLDVIAPSKNTPRSEVAFFAADFICQNYPNAKVTRIDTNDLLGLVQYLDEQYLDLYDGGGANLEIGLTGSKIQAVASAILSSRRKVAQAWYLSPGEFDEKRFSSGVGDIHIYDIKLNNEKKL